MINRPRAIWPRKNASTLGRSGTVIRTHPHCTQVLLAALLSVPGRSFTSWPQTPMQHFFLQIIYHFISAIASHITCNNKQPLLLFSADWVSFLSRSKLNCLRSLDFQFVGYFWFLHLMAVFQKGAMF